MSRIAFDIGATHLRVGTILPEGVGNIRRIDTPQEPDAAVRALTTLAREDGIVEALYGGVPAIVREDGSLTAATNLPRWNEYPFREKLEEVVGAPVRVRNDAELAALGEVVHGAGKGVSRVAYLGLGTGVGTALIVDGGIVPHTSNGRGRDEVLMLANGSSLEDIVSGRALARTQGMAPAELPRAAWRDLAAYLAEGIENAARAWKPDVVVLGGSLMNEATGFRLADVEEALGKRTHGVKVPLRTAALKDAAGLYGGKAWAETEPAA